MADYSDLKTILEAIPKSVVTRTGTAKQAVTPERIKNGFRLFLPALRWVAAWVGNDDVDAWLDWIEEFMAGKPEATAMFAK